MDLKIKDIVDIFQVSEKTVYRWIKDKKIPCYRIQHQYRFNRSEINEWILSNKIEVSSHLMDKTFSTRPTNFTDLLRHGGVFPNIPGLTVPEVLLNAIKHIHLPGGKDPEDIYQALLNREELTSTAIGHGIAIPHPRNPIITNIEDASVSICFLENPVDFGALDSQPVHTLFVLLTYSPRRHLEVLSKISFLCQMDDFREMLKQREPEEKIVKFIESRELSWKKGSVKS